MRTLPRKLLGRSPGSEKAAGPGNVTGGRLDATGGGLEVTGGGLEVTGGGLEVTGGGLEVTGGKLGQIGRSWHRPRLDGVCRKQIARHLALFFAWKTLLLWACLVGWGWLGASSLVSAALTNSAHFIPATQDQGLGKSENLATNPAPGLPGGGAANGKTAAKGEIDWIWFIFCVGATLGIIAIAVYALMAIKDWMQEPPEYETAGDDLESLREALKLGSIDVQEYRKAVFALQSMSQRLATKTAEPLEPVYLRQALDPKKTRLIPENEALSLAQEAERLRKIIAMEANFPEQNPAGSQNPSGALGPVEFQIERDGDHQKGSARTMSDQETLGPESRD